MLLGLLLHAFMSYTSWDLFPHFVVEKDSSVIYDYTVLIIHTFRMPIFFVLAGFFAALLYLKRGNIGMIKNRFFRIFLPLLVSYLLIAPLTKMLFMHYAIGISWDEIVNSTKDFSIFNNLKLSHLWFLYYLFIIYLIVHFFKIIKIPFLSSFFVWCPKIIDFKYSFLLIFLLSILSFCFVLPQNVGMIDTAIEFIPNMFILLSYLVYFLFGFMLFSYNNKLHSIFSNWKIYLLFGVLLSVLYCYLFTLSIRDNNFYKLAASSYLCCLISWCYIYGFLGLFLNHFNINSKLVALIGKSSYWVYLLHLPIIIICAGFLVNYSIPTLLKAILAITFTYSVLLIAYKLFVEKTIIGVFLNGKSKD